MAKTISVHQNLPGLPIVELAHPVGAENVNLVQKKADDIIDNIIHVLTTDRVILEKEYKNKEYEIFKDVCHYADVMATRIKEEKFNISDSIDEINEVFYGEGWSDGLPVIPPTEDRVNRMLTSTRRSPDEVVAILPPRMGAATVKKIAVNAVMAGCLPQYLPVLIAAVEAIAEERYGLSHRQTTTHAGAPLVIVNGPIVKKLGLNSGTGLFGPGWRPNATIGRALRLILINIGGAIPGLIDMSQHGHPGKYTYCIAENEDSNPWEPLHIERGFPRDISTVTVVNAEAPHSMTENKRTDPIDILTTFVSSMATLGGNNIYSQGEPILVLGPEHARYIAKAGWSKYDVRVFIFEKARQPWRLVRGRGKSMGPYFPKWVNTENEEDMVPIINKPEDLIVIVAGGAGGKSMWIPTAGAQSLSVTKAIKE